MAFPRKFRHLIEMELKDVETPDYVWLMYAVCACEKDSCGWGGWMISSAFKKTEKRYSNATGDKSLQAVRAQVCPSCGKGVFGTAAMLRMVPSEDQEFPLVEGRDYESLPIEYED